MNSVASLELLETRVEDGLGTLIDAARREVEELHRQREQLDREITDKVRKLRAWEYARDSLTRPRAGSLVAVPDELPTKREAVLAFLGEHPDEDFKLIQIRRGLIARGWMAGDAASIHALEVAVRTMEQRGELRRPRKGIYTMRPRAEEPPDSD